MGWFRCESILDVLLVADQYPDGVLSMAPYHEELYMLGEIIADRSAWAKWVKYQRECASMGTRRTHISLFGTRASMFAALHKYDQICRCDACFAPISDHPTGAIMAAPLNERLAYCLRAHINAEKQGRAVSDNIKRMSADALNEYEATRAGDAVPPPRPDTET